jgi:TatD DNase family protein
MIETRGLVDFHCHLDLYPDFEAAVREADEAGVFTLSVTTTPKAWARNEESASKTKHVRAALGLHPQLVEERANEIGLWESLLPQTRYVGEVGLDAGPRYYKSFEVQKQIFTRVLQCCALAGNKIITIHSVRATKAVLDHIEEHLPPTRGKAVLHWFTGTRAEARRAVELGCFFSINSPMVGSSRHRALILDIPLERILTETDGPFAQIQGRPSKPVDIAAAVDELAILFRMPSAALAKQIRANLTCLLSENE